jgi:hypothetical protein
MKKAYVDHLQKASAVNPMQEAEVNNKRADTEFKEASAAEKYFKAGETGINMLAALMGPQPIPQAPGTDAHATATDAAASGHPVIRVFIGYDEREAVAANVFASSIQRRSSVPVAITPIVLEQLSVFTRKPDPLQSTAFSFYSVSNALPLRLRGLGAVCRLRHAHAGRHCKAVGFARRAIRGPGSEASARPTETTKFLGAVQTKYEKKNWSSLMLMNCGKCKALTPEYVNTASGLELHQFKWLGDDSLIGELPAVWNNLVGYDDWGRPSLLHYTTGGPWFKEYEGHGLGRLLVCRARPDA